MPTILDRPYPPNFAARPPRMSAEDFPIWTRYYPRIQDSVRELYFDVGLGLPDELPISTDAAQLLGWIRNTQKRADVIAVREVDVLLIELRYNAQLNALGRLRGYKLLLDDDNPFSLPIIPVLVTNRRDSEVARVAELDRVVYEIV